MHGFVDAYMYMLLDAKDSTRNRRSKRARHVSVSCWAPTDHWKYTCGLQAHGRPLGWLVGDAIVVHPCSGVARVSSP